MPYKSDARPRVPMIVLLALMVRSFRLSPVAVHKPCRKTCTLGFPHMLQCFHSVRSVPAQGVRLPPPTPIRHADATERCAQFCELCGQPEVASSGSDERLRRHPTITASVWRSGGDGTIPFWMERVACDVEAGHLLVGDFDPFRVRSRIEFAAHDQAGCGRRGRDQVHDGRPAGKGLAAPGPSNMAEQPVLDFVPF